MAAMDGRVQVVFVGVAAMMLVYRRVDTGGKNHRKVQWKQHCVDRGLVAVPFFTASCGGMGV